MEKELETGDERVRAENTDVALIFFIVYFGETPE